MRNLEAAGALELVRVVCSKRGGFPITSLTARSSTRSSEQGIRHCSSNPPDALGETVPPAVRNLERAAGPRSVAMKVTGHRTEAVYRRYAIVSDADLREASERLTGTIPGTVAGRGAILAAREDGKSGSCTAGFIG